MAESDGISENRYHYSPLPTPSSIRLLRRLGDTSNGLLSFALDTVDLRNRPQYHCLSYTWGNPYANGSLFREEFERAANEYDAANLFPIRVNGKSLKVRKNLYEALCELPTSGWITSILNRPDPESMRTRLHDKAEEGNADVVYSHIISGADVHARDRLGRLPLHYAASKGHLQTAKILMKAGADASAVDAEQKTAKDVALEHGEVEMADLLTECAQDGGKAILDAISDFVEYGPDARIWIDALCIDQENLEERAIQVSIMDSVYSEARYIIVWLGRQDRYTDAALETVAKIVKFGNALTKSNIVPYRTYPPEDYQKAQLPYISQYDWDALASLFLRQWFRRIWIVQEIIFATGIIMYCGGRELQWTDLMHVVRLLKTRYHDVGHASSSVYIPMNNVATSVEYFVEILYSFRELKFDLDDSSRVLSQNQGHEIASEQAKKLQEPFSWFELILASFPFYATDHRDKIFALYAVSRLNSKMGQRIRPDYKKPVEQLYSEVTKAIIETQIDLRILSVVQDESSKQIKQLPSWVPDFSLQGTGILPSSRFMACGSSSLTFGSGFYFSDWNELILKGVAVDVIDRTASQRLAGGKYRKFVLDPSWFDLILSMDTSMPYHQTGQLLSEVLWRTLCANTVLRFSQNETQAPPECGDMFKTLVCAMICAEPEHRTRAQTRDLENAIQLGNLFKSALRTSRSDIPSVDRVEPDENHVVSVHRKSDVQDNSLSSPLFDSVRSTLSKLDKLAASKAGAHFPTSHEVEAYFKRHTNPITRPDGLVEIPPETNLFAQAHSTSYGGRRLFATSKGYLGLGPVSLDVGDTVCLLPGAKVPFLLRPTAVAAGDVDAQELQQFKLVGEAYVHGIMEGEAAPKNDASIGWEEIKIV